MAERASGEVWRRLGRAELGPHVRWARPGWGPCGSVVQRGLHGGVWRLPRWRRRRGLFPPPAYSSRGLPRPVEDTHNPWPRSPLPRRRPWVGVVGVFCRACSCASVRQTLRSAWHDELWPSRRNKPLSSSDA